MKRIIIGAVLAVSVAFAVGAGIATDNKAPTYQGSINPKSAQAKKARANQITLLVARIDAKGNFYLGKVPVTLDHLRSQLAADAAKNPQLRLAVNADKGAPWSRVVGLMDAAKEAHIK